MREGQRLPAGCRGGSCFLVADSLVLAGEDDQWVGAATPYRQRILDR